MDFRPQGGGMGAAGGALPGGPEASPASTLRQQAQFGRPDDPPRDQALSGQAMIAQLTASNLVAA